MIFPFLKKLPGVRRLFDVPMLGSSDVSDLSKTIYIYWDTGFAQAPDICRYCRDSWKRLNPDWTVVELDKQSASEFLDPATLPQNIEPCHYADLLRVELLRRFGGVWADATLLCLKPLDEWLPLLFTQTDFFLFSRPSRDRMISNWFIAATARSEMMRRWGASSFRYWRGRNRLPLNYFWQHALFQQRVLSDRTFKQAFRSMPKMSADTCHALLYALRRGEISKTDCERIRHSPVQKLSHKDGFSIEQVEKMMNATLEENRTKGAA